MLRSCIPASSKVKPKDLIHDSHPEFNYSDFTDSDNQSDDSEAQNGSVSDQESVTSDLPISQKKKGI